MMVTYSSSPAPHVAALREEVARRGWRIYDEQEGQSGYRLWITDNVYKVHAFVYVASVQVQDVNERKGGGNPLVEPLKEFFRARGLNATS